MNEEKVDRFSGLGALQIAVLAIVGSTIAAVTTSMALRRIGMVHGRSGANRAAAQPQPAVPVTTKTTVPTHFTEDVVLPGITSTGVDVREQDERSGRSPEGV